MSRPKKPKRRNKKKGTSNDMDVRRVTFTKETETRLAAQAQGISNIHRHNLRVKGVREYIDSQPTGIPIKLEYIIQSAGYDAKDPKEYQKGWVFVNRIVEKGEVHREKIPNSHSSYWWNPENPNIKSLKNIAVEEKIIPTKKVEVEPEDEEVEQSIKALPEKSELELPPIRDEVPQNAVKFSIQVRTAAKDFAWDSNSDSLRDFIKWLQDNER